MTKVNKITAVVITKNEEDKIEKCLDSLKDFVDEIIIVDDLSSDGTVEICKRYKARVIIHESRGNFDNQRNIGIQNATGEWILQMDADEIVPIHTANKIIESLENPSGSVAFKLRRKNFFLGYSLKNAGGYDYMLKIFKSGRAIYVGSNVHETLKVDGAIGNIDAEVLHYPFNSINQVIERFNFYTDVESEIFLKQIDKVDSREIKYHLILKSLKLFWKLYIKKKGYRDGMYGLAWCILNVISPQIKWLKIWEKALKEGKLKNYNS